jgi:hypothetical protein
VSLRFNPLESICIWSVPSKAVAAVCVDSGICGRLQLCESEAMMSRPESLPRGRLGEAAGEGEVTQKAWDELATISPDKCPKCPKTPLCVRRDPVSLSQAQEWWPGV